jgi:hypothetical protein
MTIEAPIFQADDESKGESSQDLIDFRNKVRLIQQEEEKAGHNHFQISATDGFWVFNPDNLTQTDLEAWEKINDQSQEFPAADFAQYQSEVTKSGNRDSHIFLGYLGNILTKRLADSYRAARKSA